METVGEFTYPGDRLFVGEECAAAVTAKKFFFFIKFRECGEW